MTFFNPSVPPIRRKVTNVDLKKFPGAWRVHFKIGDTIVYSSFYTKLDQACILWGLISSGIFATAQFFPISWQLQAILWSVLTAIGTVATIDLTRSWFKEKRLRWVLYSWIILMLFGLILTDLSIFLGWGEVLLVLCHLWLGLVGVGYFCTGWGMRSRTFMMTGVIHLLSIFILPYVGFWQYLTTGIIMGGTILLLAELQWDSLGACQGN
ncbi:MAG TPA: hypothetical protein V6D28_14075 [Leptolyngbyaceae cyanobacterium]